MKLPLVNTGPTPHGIHRAESVKRCPAYFAQAYVLPEQRWAAAISQAETEAADAVALGNEEEAAELRATALAGAQPAWFLLRGSLLHVGLAHYYIVRHDLRKRPLEHSWKTAVQEALAAITTQAQTFSEKWPGCLVREDGSSILALVISAMKAYATRYMVGDLYVDGFVGAEVLYSEMVPDPTDPKGARVYPYTVRQDLEFNDRDGRRWYSDHKGLFEISARVPKRYTLSGQFLALQYWGRKRHGSNFGGVEVNIVSFETRKAGQTFDFARKQPLPAPFRVARWPADYCWAKRLEQALAQQFSNPVDYPGVTSEQICVGAYGACAFFEPCRWGYGKD